jgi:hypothetical protein
MREDFESKLVRPRNYEPPKESAKKPKRRRAPARTSKEESEETDYELDELRLLEEDPAFDILTTATTATPQMWPAVQKLLARYPQPFKIQKPNSNGMFSYLK